jgi:hypothetical protein
LTSKAFGATMITSLLEEELTTTLSGDGISPLIEHRTLPKTGFDPHFHFKTNCKMPKGNVKC